MTLLWDFIYRQLRVMIYYKNRDGSKNLYKFDPPCILPDINFQLLFGIYAWRILGILINFIISSRDFKR